MRQEIDWSILAIDMIQCQALCAMQQSDSLAGDLQEGVLSKIVGVGVHKTGTSTLGTALQILGFSWTGWNLETASIYKHGHIDALLDMMADFECFEDAPWFLMYQEAFRRYPDLKLVLTRRRNMDVWFESLTKHIDRSPPDAFSFRETIYGTNDLRSAKSHVIDTHRRHIDETREFAEKNDVPLLEVCWEEGDGWPELCDFLGRSEPNVAFPHTNAAPSPAKTLLTKVSRRIRQQLSA